MPVGEKKLIERKAVKVSVLDVREMPDPLEACLSSVEELPEARRQQLMRYKNLQPRKLCYAAGWLLSEGLKELGYPDSFIQSFVYDAYGKPYMQAMPEFPFSISHSKDLAVLALAELPYQTSDAMTERLDLKLGCDAEQINAQRNLQQERIARRFFTEEEYRHLSELPKERQAEEFCRYWTRKESVLKLIGTGIALPMNLFEVGSGNEAVVDDRALKQWLRTMPEEKQVEFEPAAKLLLERELHFHDFKFEEYCICVAETESIRVRLIPFAKKACNADTVMVH